VPDGAGRRQPAEQPVLGRAPVFPRQDCQQENTQQRTGGVAEQLDRALVDL
jgi:hypothetical protein